MNAVPFWEISRVTIDLQGTRMLLLEAPQPGNSTYGVVRAGQADLTYEEAEKLAADLLDAVHSCRRIDAQLNQYMEAEKRKSAAAQGTLMDSLLDEGEQLAAKFPKRSLRGVRLRRRKQVLRKKGN